MNFSKLFKIFLIGWIFIFYNSAYAQKQGKERLDSLLLELENDQSDTIKLRILSAIAFDYHRIDPDEGIKYSNELLELASRLNNSYYIGYANLTLGANYLSKSDYPKALDFNYKAIELFELQNDSFSMAKAFNNIGIIYFNEEDYEKALTYYLKAYLIYKKNNNVSFAATSLGNIAVVYQMKGNINKALITSKIALNDFIATNNLTGIARMTINIGNLYDTKKLFVSSLKYKYEGLKIYIQLGEFINIAKAYNDLSYSYSQIVLDVSNEELPDSLKNKNYCINRAADFIQKSIEINSTLGYVANLSSNYEILSTVLTLKKDYPKAIEAYKKYIFLKDSLFGVEKKTAISQLETKKTIELGKKELELKNLQIISVKRSRILVFSGLVIVLIFLTITYKSFTKQKHTNKLLNIEMKKSEDLLLNILPLNVANELKNNGTSEAKQYNNVTVLFTDFVNFTGISEKLTPTELVEEIHKNFTTFDAIIEKHGLEKIKTIGDAYLAVCGLPHELPDHAIRVSKAAIEIRNFMLKNEGKFQIRIGIHSGPVVAGIVGVKKYAYDIWGDTVNTANRMESNSEPGKINISGSTYELIKDHFNCLYRGKIQAKNKGEVDMYFIS